MVRLRRLLGADRIETSADGYLLDVSPEDIDARRFERLTLRGRELVTLGEPERASSLVGQALDLWRGVAYEDVQAWDPAVIESARLGELRLEAEELRVDACLRTGRHLEVLATAEGMVRSAPLREALDLAREGAVPGRQPDRRACGPSAASSRCWPTSSGWTRARSWSRWRRRSCARTTPCSSAPRYRPAAPARTRA